MIQGAAKHKLSERGHDLYQTPPCAVHALIKVEKLPPIIWEPCAGLGAISRELTDHIVFAEDLVAYDGADQNVISGRDFFFERKAPAQTIVTNPPFKLADRFIRHGLELDCDVIVLLRLMAIEGANRSDIVDGHLVRVWAGIERLPMLHRDGWEGPKITSSGVPFAWFVFSAKKKPAGAPIELRRMSWRAAP